MSKDQTATLEAAIAAMERGNHRDAIALLLVLLAEGPRARLGLRQEAVVRALLTQCLVQVQELDGATEQGKAALDIAEQSNDRDTIHRCMALLASLRILTEGRL